MMRQSLLAMLLVLFGVASSFAITREEEAKKYAGDLKHKDAKIRLTALKELARLGGASRKLVEPHIDAIMSVLKDPDPQVRGEAARTVGLIDVPDKKAAITKIAELLKDEKQENAREGQEMGLGELGALATESDLKAAARNALLEARKKTESKREQKVIQAALLLITGPKKKN